MGCLNRAPPLGTRQIHIGSGAAENADGIDLRRIQPLDEGGKGLAIHLPGLVSGRDRKSRKSLELLRHVLAPQFDRRTALQTHWQGGKKSGG
ncbi:hypothetical protein D3C80_2043460 [compost metagenome]